MSSERDIQRMIVNAVKHYFVSGCYGVSIPLGSIGILEPESGQQTSSAEAFGRKPYDVAIYAKDTAVIFLEVKERRKNGTIPEFRPEGQHETLLTLQNNGIEVSYAYNGWDFIVAEEKHPKYVLENTHVRNSRDMSKVVQCPPLPPAEILEIYLQNKTSSKGSSTLIQLLNTDKRLLDRFNSMPLMILANLNKETALIDKEPLKMIKKMKELFSFTPEEREGFLNKQSNSKRQYAQEWVEVAGQIFLMKDNWENSQKQSLSSSGQEDYPTPGFRSGM